MHKNIQFYADFRFNAPCNMYYQDSLHFTAQKNMIKNSCNYSEIFKMENFPDIMYKKKDAGISFGIPFALYLEQAKRIP